MKHKTAREKHAVNTGGLVQKGGLRTSYVQTKAFNCNVSSVKNGEKVLNKFPIIK